MKEFNKMLKIGIQLGVLFGLSLVALKFSYAFPGGIGLNECEIKDTYDGPDGRLSATLRQALYYANQKSRGNQRCRHNITVKAPVINLKAPLVISIQNTDSTNLGGASHYVIRGVNPDGGRVTINANDIRIPKGADISKNCAIIFRDTHHVKLENINFEKIPNGLSGICFEDKVNNIEMDNMRLSQVWGGHGLVIFNEANSMMVRSNSELDQIHGDGIHIQYAHVLAHNALDATSRPFFDGTNEEGELTDANGVASFADVTGPTDFVMRQIFGEFVHSEAPNKILFSIISQPEPKKFLIEGAVVKKEISCVPLEILSINPDNLEQNLKRLQVYAVGVSQAGSTANRSAVFLTYVTKQSVCVDQNNCNFGIGQYDDITGTLNQNGTFRFMLDTQQYLDRLNAALPPDAPRVSEIGEIVLIPEMADQTITSSSKVIKLRAGNTEDTSVCAGSGTAAGSGSGSTLGSGYIRLGYKTRDMCRLQKPRGQLAPLRYDSDGDGIEDRDEDINGDCNCDPQEFSCWDKPDSDGDGITDLEEKLGDLKPNRYDRNTRVFATGYCNEGDIPNTNPAVHVSDLCDVDKDGISNAQEDQSDTDCLRDYEEDRARIFVPGRDAHFYIWGGVGNLVPYRDIENAHVACTEVLRDAGKVEVGAKYGVFRVKRDFSGAPVEHDFVRVVAADEELMLLVCRNDSIRTETNLNGKYESAKGETHAYVSRTNQRNPANVDDCTCAGTFDTTTNECILDCVDYDIFKELPDAYVNTSRTALADANSDGVPDLYDKSCSEIKTLCTDIDRDNIPDCVENVTGQCIRVRVDGGQNLDPYRKDSDKDGKFDGAVVSGLASDRCPFNPGETCDQRRVYVHRPILACYLDRDGDGLMDAQEDFGDGSATTSRLTPKPDSKVDIKGGLEGRATTETDPLSSDTDDDGLGDFIEAQTWNYYTNPADHDTDRDRLPDRLEVEDASAATPLRDYPNIIGRRCTVAPIDSNSSETSLRQMAKTTARGIGTNPANRDTDGDGIEDGVEIMGKETTTNPIGQPNLLVRGFQGDIDLVSHPLSTDSDGDALSDKDEYGTDGMMQYSESSPCDTDTDNDTRPDNIMVNGAPVKDACPADPNPRCVQISGSGTDRDSDGLSDDLEVILGTDPEDPDSDDDNLNDGEEDFTGPTGKPDGKIDESLGETNPVNSPDTDHDGLKDGDEKKLLKINPLKADTDGDCILDGVEVNFNIHSAFTGTDTNPRNPDTDGDGLCDGDNNISGYLTIDGKEVTCIRGEDMAVGSDPSGAPRKCNGKVDIDPANPNRFLETDPRNADTDSDGESDKSEFCANGTCSLSNVPRATEGKSEGCFSLTGQHSGRPTSMIYLFGLLLVLNRILRRLSPSPLNSSPTGGEAIR